eukprot:scaffold4.g4827.t1
MAASSPAGPLTPPFQLLVFDTRRGNEEGSEDDKVLAAHPPRASPAEHSSLAGLFQGLLLFSSTFGQGAWNVAETDKSTWVLHEAEPHIWFALAAAKSWLPRHTTEDCLRGVLLHAHMLATVLAGTVQSLLDQDATAVAAQEALLPVLRHVARQLGASQSWLARELRNPLSALSCYPTLPLTPPAALALQTMCNRLLLDSAVAVAGVRGGRVRPVQELLVLYGQQVLWSTALPEDTAALFSLLAAALLDPGGAASAAASPSSTAGGGGGGAAALLDSDGWQLLPGGFVVERGGLVDAFVGGDEAAAVAAPAVCLTASQRWLRLLPLAEGKLLAVMLLDPELVAQDIKASRCEAGHIPGFRFLAERPDRCAAQASPRDKISAMSHHARALAAGLRDSLSRAAPAAPAARRRGPAGRPAADGAGNGLAAQLNSSSFVVSPRSPAAQQAEGEDAGGEDGARGGGAGGGWLEADAAPREVLVRSSQDCWAAAVAEPERRVLVVRERRNMRFVDAQCQEYGVSGWNGYSVLKRALQSPSDISALFAKASSRGLNVLRMFAGGEGDGVSLLTGPGPSFDEATFRALDYVLDEAASAGIKVILVPLNLWKNESMPALENWCGSAASNFKPRPDIDLRTETALNYTERMQTPYAFFTTTPCIDLVKRYYAALLARVNTVSGLRYTDDPTIFAWDLLNEPRCKYCGPDAVNGWYHELARYMKEDLGVKQMVTTGGPRSGQSFTQNHNSPHIDFAVLHLLSEYILWPDNWRNPPYDTAWGKAWIDAHEAAAAAIGKPALLEEFGKNANESEISAVRDPWFQWDSAGNMPRSDGGSNIRMTDSTFTNYIESFSQKVATDELSHRSAGSSVPGCTPVPLNGSGPPPTASPAASSSPAPAGSPTPSPVPASSPAATGAGPQVALLPQEGSRSAAGRRLLRRG